MSLRQSKWENLLTRLKEGTLYWLLTLLMLAVYIQGFAPLQKLEYAVEDTVRSTRKLEPDRANIAIVGVDTRSINEVGKWPWNYARLSDLLITICDYKPKVVMLNFSLAERVGEVVSGRSAQLALGIAECGNVVLPFDLVVSDQGRLSRPAPEYFHDASYLPTSEMPLDGFPKVIAAFVPPKSFASKARAVGFRYLESDPDEKVRSANMMVNYEDRVYISTPLQLANVYLGHSPADIQFTSAGYPILDGRILPTDKRGRLLVDVPAADQNYTMYSAIDILTGDADRSSVAGKAVIVTATNPEDVDSVVTGTVAGIPSYNFYAAVVQNLISGKMPKRLDFPIPIDLLLILALGLFGGFVLPRMALIYRLIALFGIAFVLANVNFVLFSSLNMLMSVVYPTITAVLFFAASFAVKTVEVQKAASTTSKELDLKKLLGNEPIATRREGDRDVSFDEMPTRFLHDEKPSPEVFQETIRLDFEALTKGGDLIAASEYAKHDKTPGRTGKTEQPVVAPPQPEQSPAFIPDLIGVDMSNIRRPDGEPPPPKRTGSLASEPELVLTPEERKIYGVRFSNEGQPVSFGRYVVIEPLGMGAMGTVYKGKDPSIDRLVALKTIRLDSIADKSEIGELRERLSREAKAAGNLSHPNIVTIYDFGLQGNLQYIAMEYIEGYTLESVLERQLQLNYRIIASIVMQVCSALEYAHKMGIIHRDVKPANIMVMENFKVKVMDFGIAHFESSSMTQTGIAMGTPNYISPEQLKGKEVTPSSDIFSLGVVLYELLTHRKPFAAENISSLINQILNEQPPPPSSIDHKIPPLFDLILRKALAKDPAERYRTAKDMSAALDDFTVSFAKKAAAV
jgi:serine/threonine-protein kinase